MPPFGHKASHRRRKIGLEWSVSRPRPLNPASERTVADRRRPTFRFLGRMSILSSVNFCASTHRLEIVRTYKMRSVASLMKPVRSRRRRRLWRILNRDSVCFEGRRLRTLADQVAAVPAQTSQKPLGQTNGEAVRGFEVQPARHARAPSAERVPSRRGRAIALLGLRNL